jgi:hypothetical protein
MGLEDLGYREGEHYVVGIRPPKHFVKNVRSPKKDFDHYISFCTGAGIYILSGETKHNGASLDFLLVEEARLINETSFQQVFLATRGNATKYAHLPSYQSLMLVSDMPENEQQAWFLKMVTPTQEINHALRLLSVRLSKHKIALLTTPNDEQLLRKIEKLEKIQNKLRLKSQYLGTATSLDNIHLLGSKKLQDWERSGEEDFKRSVLSIASKGKGKPFYVGFSEKFSGNVAIMPFLPLHISLDYNLSICSMIVAQHLKAEQHINVLSSFVDYPMSESKDADLHRLLNDFHSRYEHHSCKTLYFYYDQTAKTGKSLVKGSKTHKDTVLGYLRKLGWTVKEVFIGRAIEHERRRELFKNFFEGKNKITFTYDAHHADLLAQALMRTKVEIKLQKGRERLVKDKREEHRKVNQAQATHITEAFDMFLIGILSPNKKVLV